METQEINSANLHNLTSLWESMGADACSVAGLEQFRVSRSWPHRCWASCAMNEAVIDKAQSGLQRLAGRHIVPVWDSGTSAEWETVLISRGFGVGFKQTAMYLALGDDAHAGAEESPATRVELELVSSASEIQRWTQVSSAAFGYDIDPGAIATLANDSNAFLYTASVGAEPAATALLFQTNGVVGVHQVGVLRAFRGQGIARELMRALLPAVHELGALYITLQASAMGEGLYRSLGFVEQFGIRNYRLKGNQ
ncbi:MAG: GNAT family N-acetyltransferase [Pseudomonadota bacterium]